MGAKATLGYELKNPNNWKTRAYLAGSTDIKNLGEIDSSVNVDFIKEAFNSMPLEEAASQDFSDSAITDVLVDYINDNQLSSTGLHLLVGGQIKLLAFNAFANVRYTIAKDVVPGKKGFPSIWIGMALGI